MNLPFLPSRLRLWAARLLAAAGCALCVLPSVQAAVHGHPSLFLPVVPGLDALAIWLCGKRRFRFATALWFGAGAFFQLVNAVDRGVAAPLSGVVAALLLTTATALLVWPVLKAPSEQARLAPLSGVWVLVATLVVAAVDALLLRDADGIPRDTTFVAGFSALALFAGCALASRLGPVRWAVQLLTVVLIGAAQTSELRAFVESGKPAMDLAGLVTWLGLGTFALGLDWIRAGATGRDRFLRAFALSLATSALPLALAAFWAPASVAMVLMVASRAAALGLAGAIMPRVAGKARRGLRLLPGPVGAPPWPLMASVLGLGVIAVLVVSRAGEGPAIGVALAMIPPFLCLIIRTRFTRAALFLMIGVPLMLGAFGAVKELESWALSLAALVALGVFGWCISGPAAGRHFQRRFRWAGLPHPRASLALAGAAALGLAGWVSVSSVMRPEVRPGLLASAGGPVPLPVPLYFRPNELRDAPSPGRLTGSAVVVDPLGRGTWVVDEERDEVSLVGADKQVKRFAVSAWPELLVVTREGRVFVSCRQAGRIEVIDPDFQRDALEVGDEVRGLALDEAETRLYAGLVTTRKLVSFDPRTLEPLVRLALEEEPRSVAVMDGAVAALPDKGSRVELASLDLRRHWTVPLPGGQGTAWHGQALLPAGRDLLVLHAQVNTGLDHPVSSGGYGGSVSEPINLVATVLRSGRAPLVPPNAEETRTDRLELPDVSGVALSDGALFLASRIKGQVERVPLRFGRLDTRDRSVVDGLQTESSPPGKDTMFGPPPGALAAGNGTTGVALDGDRVVTYASFDRVLVSTSTSGGPRAEVSLGAGRLDAQLARGRRLFFRNDKAISSAHLACASCHVDGREDGLVWRLQGGRLQTPSLAGRLEDTAPYNWHGTTRTLPDNIAQTIERLGGEGLERADREALARYLTEGLRPVRAAPTGDPAVVAQGEKLFHDRTVGCSSCHDSATGFTDGVAHDVESLSRVEREELTRTLEQMNPPDEDEAAGLPARRPKKAPTAVSSAFDTPALRQLALTAPYFHDGSAKTLEELVDGNRDRMGKTSHLSTDERRALVAYLRTL